MPQQTTPQKKQIRLRRRLGFKLTKYFIIFGLILGLFLYIMTTVLNITPLMRAFGSTIAQTMPGAPKLTREEKQAQKKQAMHSVIEDFQKQNTVLSKAICFTIFSKDPKKGWLQITPHSDGRHEVKPAAAAEKVWLEKAMTNEHVSAGGGFMINVYFRVNEKVENLQIDVIHLQVQKHAIFEKIKSDRDLLIGFGIILVLFSIILGTFFARKITCPLDELIVAAQAVSEGNYSYRNSLRNKDEIGYLGRVLNEMSERVDSHISEIEFRAKTMGAMNQIDKTVLAKLLDPTLVPTVAQIVASFLERGTVALVLPDKTGQTMTISLYPENQPAGLTLTQGGIALASLTPDTDYRRQGFTQIIRKPGDSETPWLKPVLQLEKGTVIHAPLMSAGSYYGSCFVIDPQKTGYSPGEAEAIRMLADQVGVTLQNARIYREKEDLLLELLFALTRAIDAKSKWTAGHSERVAEIAMTLGHSQGLSEDELNTLKMAAMLHDIGKIATPEYILDKPGRLTNEEYAEIKKHPGEGARIIGSNRAYSAIVPGIENHHEHWDGTGYPHGLKGEEIPLCARIITIADVYDAISADRPYRKGMEPAQARQFMADQSGKLFDPRLLEVFLKNL